MRRQYTGGKADHVAPRFAVIGTEGQIIAIPRMLGMLPAGFLWDANAKSGHEQSAAQLDQIRINHRPAQIVWIVFVEEFSSRTLEMAEVVHPKFCPINVQPGKSSRTR